MSEMALGIRHQFDLAGVVLAMGSAGLSSEIKIANPLERSIVADLGVAAMGGVVRGRIDVENLAIQLISDSARYAVQQSYANSSVSDEYHQSQRASRGEGHITQTTVDQQWESHLINDAEFTANTQLPSVTLDVNDSYVSQQLGQRVGEEVSHFYHPTPPPPRNPTGFWRGIDDVVKMQEGTRKVADLFFTGNYEAPRDSWETAGFMIGAPIALSSLAEAGVERLGTEAIETLYQGSQRVFGGVASKLERWGVFGHNGVKSLPNIIHEEENFARAGSLSSLRAWTPKARIKAAQLPNEGKIRFVPRHDYHPSMPLPKWPNKGYIDRFGNEWTKGPSRTPGQPFEWDVQLSPLGQKQLGWASRDGIHLNVSLDGKITHR